MSDEMIEKTIPRELIIVFQGIIVILSMAIGYFGHQFILQYRGDLGLVLQARDILLENTILEVPPDPALEYGMIRGMLAVMDDPYTAFVDPPTHEVLTDDLTGRYGGIGVRLERDLQANWRLYPLFDSPALEAGIQDGDLLISVDDLLVTSLTEEVTLIAALRGPEGEAVSLTIQRDGELITFSIQRQSVPLPSVTWHVLPDAPRIGMLRVNRIAETTPIEIQDGIEDLLQGGITGLIIDLRDNGGGLVDAGAEIAGLFLHSGEIIQQGYKGESIKTFEVDQPGPFLDLPLVLLINSNTASSAEIVAGALKAHERAALVGSSTHGKTSIQFIFGLTDGSSIHVTSGRWWIPGVTFPLVPDFPVQDDPEGIALIRTALQIFEHDQDE